MTLPELRPDIRLVVLPFIVSLIECLNRISKVTETLISYLYSKHRLIRPPRDSHFLGFGRM